MRTVLISNENGNYGETMTMNIESTNRLNRAHSAPYIGA
jgi:hypothetical protein